MRITDISRIDTFESFIEKIQPKAGRAGGRYFKYEQQTYSMNQIVHQFEKCLKNSGKSPSDLDKTIAILTKIKKLNTHLVFAKTSVFLNLLTRIKQILGNLLFTSFHADFNKKQILDRLEKMTINELEELSEKGVSTAQSRLGHCYYNGEGVEKNFAKAVQYFQEAADQNDASAQFGLSLCLMNGQGIERNIEEAIKLCRSSAEKNYSRAQLSLGLFYYQGEGVEKNLEEAINFFRLAAHEGSAEAQMLLGTCLMAGEGIQQDLEEAERWLKSAANQENELAKRQLAMLYIMENTHAEEAVKYLQKAAKKRDVVGQFLLGISFLNGFGLKKDLKRGIKYIKLAADQGHAIAQVTFGKMLAAGTGVKKNPQEAFKYYELSAAQNNSEAQCLAAIFLWQQENAKPSSEVLQKILTYFKQSANQNYVSSLYFLGKFYEAKSDRQEALKYYKLAEAQGSELAKQELEKFK